MSGSYVPDYEDYQSLKKIRKAYQNDYQTARRLKAEIQSGSIEHKTYREQLWSECYAMNRQNRSWTGADAESFANTALEILHELWQADEDYKDGLRDIMAHCDEKLEYYAEKILETEEKMDAWAKAKHVWNAGVLGNMDG